MRRQAGLHPPDVQGAIATSLENCDLTPPKALALRPELPRLANMEPIDVFACVPRANRPLHGQQWPRRTGTKPSGHGQSTGRPDACLGLNPDPSGWYITHRPLPRPLWRLRPRQTPHQSPIRLSGAPNLLVPRIGSSGLSICPRTTELHRRPVSRLLSRNLSPTSQHSLSDMATNTGFPPR